MPRAVRLAALAVLAAAATAVPASAQPAPPSPAAVCELHFWGSRDAVTSTYNGVGGALGAALSGPRPQSEAGLVSDLPPSVQAEALRHIDLARLLQMPDVRLIEETAPFPGKAKEKGPRRTASTAPCYAELVVDYIGYSSHITAGRKFGARYWLRRFPPGAAVARVQNGGKDVGLKIYPAKKPENHEAGLAELAAAFGRTTQGFLEDKMR
jgi:hypothetical protein